MAGVGVPGDLHYYFALNHNLSHQKRSGTPAATHARGTDGGKTRQPTVIMFLHVSGFHRLAGRPCTRSPLWLVHIPLYVVIAETSGRDRFYFIFLVYRENTYTSATIEVAANQKVIESGPYTLVRHPMYASALLYLLGTPLALGSYWGLLPFAAVIPFLIWRLFDRRRCLRENLTAYAQYQQRVRYRLVPGVW